MRTNTLTLLRSRRPLLLARAQNAAASTQPLETCRRTKSQNHLQNYLPLRSLAAAESAQSARLAQW